MSETIQQWIDRLVVETVTGPQLTEVAKFIQMMGM